MNDQVETTDLSQSELFLVDTGGVDLLPDPESSREEKTSEISSSERDEMGMKGESETN